MSELWKREGLGDPIIEQSLAATEQSEPIKIFEVLTKHGDKFRYDDASLRWQFGIKEGTLDITDKTSVEIIRTYDDGDYEIIQCINDVIRVGDVCESTTLEMPRQVMIGQCKKCGHTEETAHPPKHEPLSDERIAELWGDTESGNTEMVRNFAREIEKALKGVNDETV